MSNNTKIMHGVIPYMFDCWADPVVLLLLLKSSMGDSSPPTILKAQSGEFRTKGLKVIRQRCNSLTLANIFKMVYYRLIFSIFAILLLLTLVHCSINIALDWIQTRVHWCRMRPLCQLSHDQYPTSR